jgi:hypothetical protein
MAANNMFNLTITKLNSVVFSVNHLTQQVQVLTYKNEPVTFHLFGQHIGSSVDLDDKFQYPGLASSIKLPVLNRYKPLKMVVFDENNQLRVEEVKMEEKMYFAHHHYEQYYVYGQVPVVLKNNMRNKDSKVYIGSPIFNHKNALVSVVSDIYLDNQNNVIFPVSGQAGGVQGTYCLDGSVWLTHSEDSLSSFPKCSTLDLHVCYDDKNIYLYLVYEGRVLSWIKIKGRFAGNVLIC